MRNLGACWLVIAAILTGCSSSRDLDLGGNRYMVTATGNSYANFSLLEQTFAQRAQEVARLHGFDSFRVIQLSSGFEHTPLGPRPTVKGVVFLYNGAKPTGSAGSKSARPAGSMASGTAFAVSANGVLLTNAHVAGDCREISVRQFDGTTFAASLLAADATNDLALIKITAPTPDFARFRGNPEIRQGDNVIAIGFPLHGILSAGTTLTTGTVSALAGIEDDSRDLQVSAPIQPGNSGGPLLDQSGNVVGIVSASLNAVALAARTGSISENVNFAIKTTVIRTFMDAHGVTYQLAPSEKQMSTAEIGERARKFTDFVTCTS
jgi:S1-C subfamily serine protease